MNKRRYNELGKYIRECREAVDLTQVELAKQMGEGITQKTISAWETGVLGVPKKYIKLLAQAIKADEERLLALKQGDSSDRALRMEKNILSLIKAAAKSKCTTISAEDLLFLDEVQDDLSQAMTSELLEQLLAHRQSK